MSVLHPSVRRPAPPPPLPAALGTTASKTTASNAAIAPPPAPPRAAAPPAPATTAARATSGPSSASSRYPFEGRRAPFVPPPLPPARPRFGAVEPQPAHLVSASSSPELRELDTPARAVEVSVLWGANTVLHVEHLNPPRAFVVGEAREDEDVDVLLGEEALGLRRMPLCVELPEGVAAIVPPGATVTLRHEGRVLRRADLEHTGRLLPYVELTGASSVLVPEDGSVRVEQGAFVFVVRAVPSAKKIGAGFSGFDMRSLSYFGGSMAFFALLLVAFTLAPPRPSALALDLIDQRSHLVRYVVTAPVPNPPEPAPTTAGGASGSNGASAPDDAGSAGDPREPRTGRMSQRGSDARTLPRTGPSPTPESMLARSVLGVIRDVAWHQPSSVFTSATALSADAANHVGDLISSVAGPGGGRGGLAMRGTGVGGDRGIDGVIGVGGFNTLGGLGGPGGDGTYGTCRGERCGALGPRKIVVPNIRGCGGVEDRSPGHPCVQVQGSLGQDVIRRVVRRHLPEIRSCYEQALVTRPDLEGRVAVRFIIDPSGVVQAAVVQETSIRNANVESCVSTAVRRWSFPAPQGGGPVIVNYPFQFTQSG